LAAGDRCMVHGACTAEWWRGSLARPVPGWPWRALLTSPSASRRCAGGRGALASPAAPPSSVPLPSSERQPSGSPVGRYRGRERADP
jgi:hypothetical protein